MCAILATAVTLKIMLVVAFTSCDNNSLDVQDIIKSDYSYIEDNYEKFRLYEVDVHFDQTIDNMGAQVDGVRVVFQVLDTCIILTHRVDSVDTAYYCDYWLECMEIKIDDMVTFDECMKIVKKHRSDLNTQNLTLRRPLAPPFPDNAWWIFGNGKYIIDSKTGRPVVVVSESNQYKYINSFGQMIDEWIAE